MADFDYARAGSPAQGLAQDAWRVAGQVSDQRPSEHGQQGAGHVAQGHVAQDQAGPSQTGQAEPGQANISTLVNIGGAMLSLALMVGVGVWGYRLLSRDVTGLPVVRAVEGPMRVQPADPGGEPADHQGLAVNDVAALGSAAAPADRLVLAPQPVRLMDEDRPGTAPVTTQVTQAAVPAAIASADVAQAAPAGAAPITELTENADVADLVNRLTEGVEPIAPAQDEAATPPATPVVAVLEPQLLTDDAPAATETDTPADTSEAPAQVIAAASGVVRSPRPRLRPAQEAAIQASLAPTDGAAGLDVEAETLPSGTRLAQLGAYESAEIARAEWTRISARFTDYFEGKQRVIQKASSGGRTFYRLRAMGFDDLSDARRFCAVLVAGNSDCIPVTTR